MRLPVGTLPTATCLQDYFWHHIPLTRQMGLEVAALDRATIRLSAPLAPNVNDKGSAFGGSLASMMTLAGWGLLMANLCAEGITAEVMIHKSELLYNQPLYQDFSAYCDLPEVGKWQRFLRTLNHRGRARIITDSWVAAADHAAATLRGRYAVMMV